MDKATILRYLAQLHLPNPAGAIIVSGTAMAVLGLRTTNDVDLVVDQQSWQYLINQPGWSVQRNQDGDEFATDGTIFDVWQGWRDSESGKRLSFSDIAQHCEPIHEGYLLPSKTYQIVMKRMLGRVKDEVDIEQLQA